MAPSRPLLAGQGAEVYVRSTLPFESHGSTASCSVSLFGPTAKIFIFVTLLCRDQQSRWRREDIEQRHLDNARVLWGRILERNRRDVEEKSEQLKAISTLAALISGFALTAFLQFDFGPFQDRTGVALPLFGISMALTVRLHGSASVVLAPGGGGRV